MRKKILDIPIDWLSPNELDSQLTEFVHDETKHHITTVNPEFIVLSQNDADFRSILQASSLSLADGTGIVIAQTYLEKKKPKIKLLRLGSFIALCIKFIFTPQSFPYKRITGVDLTHHLLLLSQQHGWRIFLLGAAPDVAQAAAEKWDKQYPGAVIVGTSSANPDDATIVEEIRQHKPDILLVAYGAPKQEKFIAQRLKNIYIPVMVGVGGTFDSAIGNLTRGPSLIRAIGLEWLARLIQQPKRFKRIYASTVTFISLLIK